MNVRWMLLIVIELYAWIATALFVVLRYRLDRVRASNGLLVSILALETVLAAVGVVDWARSGEWTLYQTVIVAVLAYTAVWGKRDLRRLDAWIERRRKARNGRVRRARRAVTAADGGSRRPRRSRRAAGRALSPAAAGVVEVSARASVPHRNACSCP
jgi:hypothetical protein